MNRYKIVFLVEGKYRFEQNGFGDNMPQAIIKLLRQQPPDEVLEVIEARLVERNVDDHLQVLNSTS